MMPPGGTREAFGPDTSLLSPDLDAAGNSRVRQPFEAASLDLLRNADERGTSAGRNAALSSIATSCGIGSRLQSSTSPRTAPKSTALSTSPMMIDRARLVSPMYGPIFAAKPWPASVR